MYQQGWKRNKHIIRYRSINSFARLCTISQHRRTAPSHSAGPAHIYEWRGARIMYTRSMSKISITSYRQRTPKTGILSGTACRGLARTDGRWRGWQSVAAAQDWSDPRRDAPLYAGFPLRNEQRMLNELESYSRSQLELILYTDCEILSGCSPFYIRVISRSYINQTVHYSILWTVRNAFQVIITYLRYAVLVEWSVNDLPKDATSWTSYWGNEPGLLDFAVERLDSFFPKSRKPRT